MPGSARWGRVELGDDAEHGAAAAAKTPTRFREKDASDDRSISAWDVEFKDS
jgi:hypothetical protein